MTERQDGDAGGAVRMFRLLTKHLPRAVFRSSEFIAAYVAVSVAALFTASMWLDALSWLLLLAFCARAAGAWWEIAERKKQEKNVLFMAGMAVLYLCGTIAVILTPISAERAAMIQLDDRRKQPALKRMEIRQRFFEEGTKIGCGDPDAAQTPACLQLMKSEQDEERRVPDPAG